jgi:N utilization substance protein A
MLRKLFQVEVPEISEGSVEIKAIAREPGSRSKVAVISNEEGVDPIGACVGQKGARITTIINELNGENIDIVEWSKDPGEFIKQALAPAKVIAVEINEEDGTADVKVEEDQLSLAIGKNGQNVRLAAKLTGWKIDIQSPEESEAVATAEPEESEESPDEGEKQQEEKEEEKASAETEKEQQEDEQDENQDNQEEDEESSKTQDEQN